MIYAIRGDILSAYQDYVDSIKALDAKQHTSADGWKFASKGKKKVSKCLVNSNIYSIFAPDLKPKYYGKQIL